MIYAAFEIIAFLAIAGFLGFGLGWLVRDLGLRQRLGTRWEHLLRREREKCETAETELEAARMQMEAGEAELQDLQARLHDSEEAGELARREIDTLRSVMREPEALKAIESQLAILTEEIALARAEVHRLQQTKRAEPLPAPAPDAGPRPEAEAPPVRVSEAAVRARVAEIAKRTAGAESPADDDLKKIRGIGPVLEDLLKDLGITSYRQVANFTRDDIHDIAAAMNSFPDRIVRDDWIGGAREEHLKKYGADPCR